MLEEGKHEGIWMAIEEAYFEVPFQENSDIQAGIQECTDTDADTDTWWTLFLKKFIKYYSFPQHGEYRDWRWVGR